MVHGCSCYSLKLNFPSVRISYLSKKCFHSISRLIESAHLLHWSLISLSGLYPLREGLFSKLNWWDTLFQLLLNDYSQFHMNFFLCLIIAVSCFSIVLLSSKCSASREFNIIHQFCCDSSSKTHQSWIWFL